MTEIQTLPVVTQDEHHFELRIAEAAEPNAAVAMLFPAMGVAASYYDHFALGLAAAGVHCVVSEQRGNGSSNQQPKAGANFGYAKLLDQDWPTVVTAVRQRYPNSRRFMIGNSLGGQLSMLFLAQHPEAAEKLALPAACSVYFKSYRQSLRILFFTQFLNFVAKFVGYMPGKRLGFGGNEAKDLIADWARQARTGNYRIKNASADYEALLGVLSMPVLAMPVHKDSLAPESAIGHLLSKIPNCDIETLRIDSKLLAVDKLKHSNWGRYPGRLPELIANWLLA